MADKYTNKNTKVSDAEITLIHSQFELISEQIQLLTDSKKKLLEQFNISSANFYLRKAVLVKKGFIKN